MHRIPREVNYDNVLEGLDFIIQHFQEKAEELFPRKIMTNSLGYQKEVYSKDEAMHHFAESDYIDCRIRAYADQLPLAKYLRHNEVAPSLIMMDIDRSCFPSDRAFSRRLNRIKKNVHSELAGTPTVLWSGNGYHVIQPIDAIVLENITDLRKLSEKPSEQFLRFAEWYLSDGKADSNHYNTLSFGNCLLRIPGSHNSKLVLKNCNVADESTQVRVIQGWNGNRPNIRLLLGLFHAYLVDQTIRGLQIHRYTRCSMFQCCSNSPYKIAWIEKLLQTSLVDNRKYCIWRILAPYLVNVRKLNDENAVSIILAWLENANSVKRLSFNPRFTAQYVRNARRIGYFPIKRNTLKQENAYLHKLLEPEYYQDSE